MRRMGMSWVYGAAFGLALGLGTLDAPASDFLDSILGRPTLEFAWRHTAPGAEIVTYDAKSRRAFVTNLTNQEIRVLRIGNGELLGTISVADLGPNAEPTSVSAYNGIVAVAINLYDNSATPSVPQRGVVRFFDARTLKTLSTVQVGFLPDSVAFSPNGKYLVVCNEGEPNSDYSVDPQGSVSVITVGDGRRPRVRVATFRAFDGQEAALRAQGVRIYGPGASASQDFEPEYAAIDPRSNRAYVTLQENNAVATVDLATAQVVGIAPLGTKDHSQAGNGLDPSDRDGGINIANWPVHGMPLPDSIASFRTAGQTFLITANEGDAREYDGFVDSDRLRNLPVELFDPSIDIATLRDNAQLGRLAISRVSGDLDGDGDIDQLQSLGTRSFTVWIVSPIGTIHRVWDSGDFFETHIASIAPSFFNVSNSNNQLDNRSDDKGPEPEAIAAGTDLGQTLGFIGLERQGGVMVYDLTNPLAPRFLEYRNDRDFSLEPAAGQDNDSGPEGIVFIPRGQAGGIKTPVILVANEVTGSTTCYRVRRVGGLMSFLYQ